VLIRVIELVDVRIVFGVWFVEDILLIRCLFVIVNHYHARWMIGARCAEWQRPLQARHDVFTR